MTRAERQRHGHGKSHAYPSLSSKLHVQLSLGEIRADLAALQHLHPCAASPALGDGGEAALVMVELADAAELPPAPLQESWFVPPAKGSHGHPLRPASLRPTSTWPPELEPAQHSSSVVSERPYRSVRRPARFEEEEVTQQALDDSLAAAAAEQPPGAQASPPRGGGRASCIGTPLPPLGKPPRPPSRQAESRRAEQGSTQVPLQQAPPAWQPVQPKAFAAVPGTAAPGWTLLPPQTPLPYWAASVAASQPQPPPQWQAAGGGMAAPMDVALDQGLLLESPSPGFARAQAQQLEQPQQPVDIMAMEAALPAGGPVAEPVLTWLQVQTILLQLLGSQH